MSCQFAYFAVSKLRGHRDAICSCLQLPHFLVNEGYSIWKVTESLFAAGVYRTSLWAKTRTFAIFQIVYKLSTLDLSATYCCGNSQRTLPQLVIAKAHNRRNVTDHLRRHRSFAKSKIIWEVSDHLRRHRSFEKSQIIWEVTYHLQSHISFEKSQTIWEVTDHLRRILG